MDKPSGLLSSPDREDPSRPNLMQLVHAGIAQGKPWARERGLGYLMHAHRLDFETSGVMLLARAKPVLITLANMFGSEKPCNKYLTLAAGAPGEDSFEVEAKLAPHPAHLGLMRVDSRQGKRARTLFRVRERFAGWTLLEAEALTTRTHQIRAHLRHVGLPLAGDPLYGGKPLLLSRLKPAYRLKSGQSERPLLSRVALHAESIGLPHPVTGEPLAIRSPWPKDLMVAVKYLRRYAAVPNSNLNAV